MDLLAAVHTPFGLDTMDLTVRFVPVLLMVFTVLATFCLVRAWPLPESAAALLASLVVLGEDFSLLPCLVLGSPEAWAVHFFGMPTTASPYFPNPLLPAVSFLMAGLLGPAVLRDQAMGVAGLDRHHVGGSAGDQGLRRRPSSRRCRDRGGCSRRRRAPLRGLCVAGAMALAMSPFAAMIWHLSAER